MIKKNSIEYESFVIKEEISHSLSKNSAKVKIGRCPPHGYSILILGCTIT